MTERKARARRQAWIESPLKWLHFILWPLVAVSILSEHWAPLSPLSGATATLAVEVCLLFLVFPCVVSLIAARWVNRSDWWLLAGLASWFGVVFVAFILPTGPDSAADDVGVTFPPGWKR